MRSLLELVEERDRCVNELKREDLMDPWARAFLAGALAMAEYVQGKNGQGNAQRPSSLTRPDTKPTAH